MYSTNKEYRDAMRKYFKMDLTELERTWGYLKDQDPESYDELLYDPEAVIRGMDVIFSKTKDNTMFMALYKLAAGCFLSEDEETGLCVLLTYDYFSDFVELYEKNNPTSEDFVKLSRRLS
jgi:hypothetical protein